MLLFHSSWALSTSNPSWISAKSIPITHTGFPENLPSSVRRDQGLSKFHQSILRRTSDRQRFVTGRYPCRVTVEENPTRKWLNLGRRTDATVAGTSEMLVNGTSVERSLASYDRFQWLDDEERQELHERYDMVSLELVAEIHTPKPGYVNVLPSDGAGSTAAALRSADATTTRWNRQWKLNKALFEELEEIAWQGPYRDRLWVTGFTLTGRKGLLSSVDVPTGTMDRVNSRTERSILWPNEVSAVPSGIMPSTCTTSTTARETFEDALLVSDGFLVPGKDRGGIYIVKNPGNPSLEWSACLSSAAAGGDRWFYHRAVWMDLTGDGRMSILTARAKLPSVLGSGKKSNRPTKGQLVWLEMPIPYTIDKATGTPLDKDGTVFDPFSARHLPWKTHVLEEGPDVMFNVADMDTEDDTIEVIASQFFGKKVTLHSIRRGPKPKVCFRRVLDSNCGSAFGSILADFDGQTDLPSRRAVVDSGSTVMTIKPGDSFSHLLVTSHENSSASEQGSDLKEDGQGDPTVHAAANDEATEGGSLFAYRVPHGKDAWKTARWHRTTVATGFRVEGQIGNMINPGAPGFLYTFYARKEDASSGRQPLIAIAGDCAESAYIFRPDHSDGPAKGVDQKAQYKLMCEIKCGATVGSIGVGYDDFCTADQESGYAKLYIPCYEKDKILVFAMGSGEDSFEDANGW